MANTADRGMPLTLVTDVFKVNAMPPSLAFEGKSNESITTPFLSPFIPSSDTFFGVKLIPDTSIPNRYG